MVWWWESSLGGSQVLKLSSLFLSTPLESRVSSFVAKRCCSTACTGRKSVQYITGSAQKCVFRQLLQQVTGDETTQAFSVEAPAHSETGRMFLFGESHSSKRIMRDAGVKKGLGHLCECSSQGIPHCLLHQPPASVLPKCGWKLHLRYTNRCHQRVQKVLPTMHQVLALFACLRARERVSDPFSLESLLNFAS